MTSPAPLPPGQRELAQLPRFGLTPFAPRFPSVVDRTPLRIEGEVAASFDAGERLADLPRVEQVSDFHCVTTWSRRALRWSGWRFADFYRQIVLPLAGASADAHFVVLRGQDGARTSLPLDDLLAGDVLLADRLDGASLPLAHGAPLRLVAPAHYGYKSVKHLHRIEFLCSDAGYRPMGLRFMQHPRARVVLEERGQGLPGWLLRYLYRPLIGPTARRFERELRRHVAANTDQRLTKESVE
jgi:DMSO/TMAO reductase YedYZ molybdopterin-dependent catalytic subunit